LTWADWFPFVFFPFKIIVLGVGMFFSIKWHHDQAKKEEREKAERAKAHEEGELQDATA
jgi:hypothetical protein